MPRPASKRRELFPAAGRLIGMNPYGQPVVKAYQRNREAVFKNSAADQRG